MRFDETSYEPQVDLKNPLKTWIYQEQSLRTNKRYPFIQNIIDLTY